MCPESGSCDPDGKETLGRLGSENGAESRCAVSIVSGAAKLWRGRGEAGVFISVGSDPISAALPSSQLSEAANEPRPPMPPGVEAGVEACVVEASG